MTKKVFLVGAGSMAMEYAKVLRELNIEFDVVGRGIEKLNVFKQQFPGVKTFEGGLNNNIKIINEYTDFVVATNVDSLSDNVTTLLNNGAKNILVEKPAVLTPSDIIQLAELAKNKLAKVIVAYNRRFYASVLKAISIIEEDGGILSTNFEFTEWAHVIEKHVKNDTEKKYLFLNNSSHVVDLAFYVAGKPREISSYTSAELSWHKPAVFSGAGITEKNVLFSYNANWLSPGRWGVEFLTRRHRLILRPMEKLQVQKLASVAIDPVEMDYGFDEKFKPGIYIQLKKFITKDYIGLCTLEEQRKMMPLYKDIAGYL